MTESLLELKDVEVEFGLPGRKNIRVLDHINFGIHEDEIVAVLGPSGSGKSSLMRVVAGLARPSAGQVLYHGEPLLGPSRRLGLVFQNAALFPWLNVEQNIVLGLEQSSTSPERKRQQVAWAMDRVGLDGYEEAYPRELSLGMKQRVDLARALATQPELLCLDDPFTSLDVLTAESLRTELLTLWQNIELNPKAILLATHNIEEAVFLANRILILSGNPAKIKAEVLNNLAYPRYTQSVEFQAMVSQIHDLITKDVMPDAPQETESRFSQRLAPLPKVEVSQMTGLLEALDESHGRLDVFDFISQAHKEYSQVLMVVNAAEMLGFVRTPGDEVEITELGRRLLKAEVNQRKILFNLQLQKIKIYKVVLDMLQKSADKRVPKESVLDEFALLFPSENPNQLFNTVVAWGRFGELLGYSARKGHLYLDRVFLSNGTESFSHQHERLARKKPAGAKADAASSDSGPGIPDQGAPTAPPPEPGTEAAKAEETVPQDNPPAGV